MRQVLVVYKYVPQYRAAFFEQLKSELALGNVELSLVYGDPTVTEALKNDAVHLSWAQYIRNMVFYFPAGCTLIYQPVVARSCRADLVIVEHANRLLVNLVLAVCSRLGWCRLAYWGHGANFQRRESFLARSLKRLQARQARWWFAYNTLSAEVIRRSGVSADTITSVMNTIDTSALLNDLTSVSATRLEQTKTRDGLHGMQVCLFVGGMYPLKRLRFLLDACTLIHKDYPAFRIVFIGSGQDEAIVRQFSEKHHWCLFKGALFGLDKAVYLRMSELLLMPGLVGLVIIDSFAAGIPLVTTNVSFHSPEIEYLQPGLNGVIVNPPDDVNAYATAVVIFSTTVKPACIYVQAAA